MSSYFRLSVAFSKGKRGPGGGEIRQGASSVKKTATATAVSLNEKCYLTNKEA